IEVKRAPVESNARVVETFETLIAPKKLSQCKAITIPAIMSIKIFPRAILRERFLNQSHNNINPVASSILYQTRGIASKEINAPNTAVNPQINTIKWKCR